MATNPVTVDVQDGNLVVGTRQHVDLIGHTYWRDSDRELLKELFMRATSAQTAGA